MRKNGVIKRILSLLLPYKPLLVTAILASLASVPLGLLVPVLVGRAIDQIIGPGQVRFDSIAQILALLASVALASALLQWAGQVAIRKLSAKAAQDLRRAAFDKMNHVPLKTLDAQTQGDIVSRLVNDADAVADGLLQGLGQLFPGVVTILSTIGLMLALNWVIAAVVILITPLSILFARFVGGRTAHLFRAQSVSQGKISSFVGEMVRGQALVQAFGFEKASTDEFGQINGEYFAVNKKATFYSSIVNPGTRFVNAIVFACVATLGGLYALTGGITVGGLSAFLSYANQYTRPFNEVTAVLTQVQSAIAGAQRLFEVVDWAAETPDQEDAAAPSQSKGFVKIEKVYFSYRQDRPLIRGFTMEALPGQRIALVGPTGCGKTTIINLLMRFYEIGSGRILVDGADARQIRRNALRALYGMVLQDTWLKSATVRENIAYCRPDASEEEVIAAARQAMAHNFIKRLPQGYDTPLSSEDSELSAGEKQLLCIARIMLAKPDMLILDEATSSIDTRTEMLIQKALERLMHGHTSFIVAHRLSTIQNADMILVMDSGQIIERGKHEELLAQNGFYARLYNSQFAN